MCHWSYIIDHLVYDLYDIIYEEVLIIDPETSITREEYDNFIDSTSSLTED